MYKSVEKDGYIYSIEIKFSPYKFTFLPLIFIQLFNNGGFKVEIGLWTFFAEFAKIEIPENHEKIFNFFKDMMNGNKAV